MSVYVVSVFGGAAPQFTQRSPERSITTPLQRIYHTACSPIIGGLFVAASRVRSLSRTLLKANQEWLFALRIVATNTAALTSVGAAITPMSTRGSQRAAMNGTNSR